jgi:imidazolonepropionase-like amidohydrolase
MSTRISEVVAEFRRCRAAGQRRRVLEMGTLNRVARCAVGLALVAAGATEAAAQRSDLAVRVGRILDVETGKYSGPSVILVNGTRISAVVPAARFDSTRAARYINLGDLTAIPGLIDVHTHLAIGGPVRANALADLRAGFTTVADQGARTDRILAIKDSINAGQIEGPRVLAAGIWVGTKGGVCEFSGIGIAGGADAFVQRVTQNIANGANLTKVCLSPWPAPSYTNADTVELSRDILRAIVDASHAAKRLVTAHAISRGAARAAVEAGVDGLVHAAYVDAPLAQAMRARRVWMAPTIASLTAGDTSAVSRRLVDGVRTARDAGVMLVFGTDGGVLPHGSGVDELEALVAAGLTPLDAIRAATTNAAKALVIADSIGHVGAGMSADFVLVAGDPLANVGSLRTVRLVIARGRVAVGP